METKNLVILALVVILLIITTPEGIKMFNSYINELKTSGENSYENIKKVEDTARSMIVSFNQDKEVYEMYKDSDSKEKQSWSEQAKIRANNTAYKYNEYMLKNSHIWKDNIPEDIKKELEVIK